MKHCFYSISAAFSCSVGLAMAQGAQAQSCAIHGPGSAPTYGAFASGGIGNSYAFGTCPPGTNGGAFYYGTDTNSLTWDGSPAQTSASGAVGTAVWGLSSASANLASGDITVSSTSEGPGPYDSTPNPTGEPASAQAGFFVQLVFSGGQGETLDYSTGGLISYFGDVSANASEIGPELGGGYSIVSGSDLASTTDQAWSTTPQAITIQDGVVYTLGVMLDVGTSGSFLPGTVTMTDPIYLDLPEGVTFTASDPSFLTGVPEPASWAMMILGVGMAGSRLRGRARKAEA